MKVLGVIPARFASTRFPGKPLVVIQGKTMIQRVYEQASKAQSLARVVVATDDERIFEHVQSFGGEVIMTNPSHQSGTDRCAEVVSFMNMEETLKGFDPNNPLQVYGFSPKKEKTTFDAVVNIQGDEPFIDPSQIDKVVDVLNKGEFVIATLVKRMDNLETILNSNIVKAIFSKEGKALYFSRSPIPYLRNTPQSEWHLSGEFYKHIGLYAYKATALRDIAQLPQSRLELLESLEQLRWLENGFSIGIAETDLETIGIDTPDDLEKIQHHEK